jgi:hypothetical protein
VVYGLPDLAPEGVALKERLGDFPKLFFDPTHKDFLFNFQDGRGKGLIVGELKDLIPKLWSNIDANHDLDMLSQHESIALNRCDEVKTKVWKSLCKQYEKLRDKILQTNKIPFNFNETMKEIEDTGIEEFKTNAPQYLPSIYESKLMELKEYISSSCSDVEAIKLHIEKEIEATIKKEKAEAEVQKVEHTLKDQQEFIKKLLEIQDRAEENHRKSLADIKEQTEARIKAEEKLTVEMRKTSEERIKAEKLLMEKQLLEIEKKHTEERAARQKEAADRELKIAAEKAAETNGIDEMRSDGLMRRNWHVLGQRHHNIMVVVVEEVVLYSDVFIVIIFFFGKYLKLNLIKYFEQVIINV